MNSEIPSHPGRGGRIIRALCLTVLIAATSAAQDIIPLTIEAEIGFGGHIPLDGSYPVCARITNQGPVPIVLSLSLLGTSVLSQEITVSRNLQISSGAVKQVTLLAAGDADGCPSLLVRSETAMQCKVVGQSVQPFEKGPTKGITILPNRDRLRFGALRVLSLGSRGRQLARALRPGPNGVPVELDGEATQVGWLEESWAPDTWLGYDGVKAILWSNPDLDALQDPAQLRALIEWVEQGGTLVILSARRPELLRQAALSRLLPARLEGQELFDYPPFGAEGFSARGPLLHLALLPGAERKTMQSGKTLRALIGRGIGKVVVGCFDPLTWDVGNRKALLRALRVSTGLALDEKSFSEDQQPASIDWSRGAGFYDFLRNGNIVRPPLVLFLLLGVLFLIAIGPFDYSFLKRRKKLRWSPVTLLLYTAMFTGLSIGASFYLFSPDEELNRIAIVDFCEDSDGTEQAYAYLYHGLFVPTGGQLAVSPSGADIFSTAMPPLETQWGNTTTGAAEKAPQRWLRSGSQAVELRLPFNTFKAISSRVRVPTSGSLQASIIAGPPRELVIRNNLQFPVKAGLFAWGGLQVETPALAAGEEKRVPLSTAHPLKAPGDRPQLSRSSEGLHQSAVSSQDLRELFRWIYRSSVPKPSNRKKGPRTPIPWNLSRALDGLHRGVYVTQAQALPFDDGSTDHPRGFTLAVLRRVVELP